MKTLAVLESIIKDDSILSTMSADQQAAIEEVIDDYAWRADYQKFLETSISDAKRFLKAIRPKKPPKKPHNPRNDVKLNMFYDTPFGLVKTYQFSSTGISYYHSDGICGISSSFEGWVERRDLVEFPHSWNPRLPREFDIYWDLKTCNDLVNHLRDTFVNARFMGPQPPPLSKLLRHVDADLRDIIKSTTIYNQPLEQIMTKFEAAQKLNLKVFDYALPQQWVDQQEAKHGESPVPYFVWGYDNNKIFGEPVCLVPGKEYLGE